MVLRKGAWGKNVFVLGCEMRTLHPNMGPEGKLYLSATMSRTRQLPKPEELAR